METMSKKVLLLNQNYEPVCVVNAKKALILVCLQKVEIIEKRELLVRSQYHSWPMPSVIRLVNYIRIPKKRVELTRHNIFRRDGFQCQYCASKKGPFTLDHIVPKVSGGMDSWENLVCACLQCNNKKGSTPLAHANMVLLKKPKRPSYLFFIQHFIGIQEECWKPYLFMN